MEVKSMLMRRMGTLSIVVAVLGALAQRRVLAPNHGTAAEMA